MKIEITYDGYGVDGVPPGGFVPGTIYVPDDATDEEIEEKVKANNPEMLVIEWKKSE